MATVVLSGARDQAWNIPLGVVEAWTHLQCKENSLAGTERCHGIKIATLGDVGDVEKVLTSDTVQNRDTMFPLFGGADT